MVGWLIATEKLGVHFVDACSITYIRSMEGRPMTPRSEGFGQKKKNQDPLLHKKYFQKVKYIKLNIMGNIMQKKFEDRNKGQNLLETEAIIVSYFKGPNIPGIKSFGYNGEYNILVMQLMGKSLEELTEDKISKLK